MDKERYEILLKEYEVSQAFSTQMGSQVWQTASIFIALSLAGVTLLGQRADHSWARLSVISVVAFASVSILALWARILRRWTSFDAVTQYRMREIERELEMWKNRYVDYMDSFMRGEVQSQDSQQDVGPNERLGRLVQANRAYYYFESGGKAVTWIRRILMIVWLAIFIQEAIFTVLHYYPIAIP